MFGLKFAARAGLSGGDDSGGEAFQIRSLRESDKDGMIGALGVLGDEAEGFFRID